MLCPAAWACRLIAPRLLRPLLPGQPRCSLSTSAAPTASAALAQLSSAACTPHPPLPSAQPPHFVPLTMSVHDRAATLAQRVAEYWFAGLVDGQTPPAATTQRWFNGGKEVDDYLTEHFSEDINNIVAGGYDHLLDDPEGALAVVVTLDQFSRNIFRGTAGMFANDALCHRIAKAALAKGLFDHLHPNKRAFVCLPFMHTETAEAQALAIQEIEKNIAQAGEPFQPFLKYQLNMGVEHQEFITRFGRFPFRNKALGRETTAEEAEFLKAHPGF